jgi:hypothetical protein
MADDGLWPINREWWQRATPELALAEALRRIESRRGAMARKQRKAFGVSLAEVNAILTEMEGFRGTPALDAYLAAAGPDELWLASHVKATLEYLRAAPLGELLKDQAVSMAFVEHCMALVRIVIMAKPLALEAEMLELRRRSIVILSDFVAETLVRLRYGQEEE